MATHEKRVDRCVLHALKSIGLGVAAGLIASTLIFKSKFHLSDNSAGSALQWILNAAEVTYLMCNGVMHIVYLGDNLTGCVLGKRWAFLLSLGYGAGAAVAGCEHELFHRQYLDPCEEDAKHKAQQEDKKKAKDAGKAK